MKKLKKKNYKVFITDYIKKPSIEKNIKNLINISKKKDAEFLLVWHECNEKYLSNFKI